MEPLPETEAAINELDALVADGDLLASLVADSARVRELVPECTGFSFTLKDQGVTFTLVATGEEIRLLDGLQYLDGGPCLRSTEISEVLGSDRAAMDEAGWHLFAQGTAARGVASTLSMPVLDGDLVVGGYNLYGASLTCFDGHHQELAAALGAWAEGAITNADLSFQTLVAARRAPQVIRDAASVDVAVGLVAAYLSLSVEEAVARLERAAERAGVPLAALARMVVDLLSGR